MNLDRDVAEDLAIQACLDLAARDVLALAAAQRRGVDAERHPERRRVDVEPGERARVGRIGERVADRDLREARDRDDVARAGLGEVDALDSVGRLERRHRSAQGHRATRFDDAGRVVRLLPHHGDPLAEPERPVPDPPDGHSPDVVVRHEVRDEELERVIRDIGRRRSHGREGVKQRPQVRAGLIHRT